MVEYSREQVARIDEQFGRRLREERNRQGRSQSDLIKDLGFGHGIQWHQSTVTKVEAGGRPVRLQEAVALASWLGVDLHDLLEDADSTGAQSRRSVRTEGRLFELSALQVHLSQRRQVLESNLNGEEGDDGEHPEAP